MQIEIPIIAAIIAAFVPLIIVVFGAIWWFGRLSTRVKHLEDDVEELKKDRKWILELLNRHLGSHEGLAPPDHPSQRPFGGQI